MEQNRVAGEGTVRGARGPLPRFSIIVPTHQRPIPLVACLNALSGLDYPKDRFEVIVVDDGGTVSPEVVDVFKDRLDVRRIAQAHAGPATARNTGAAHAGGEYFAFTDDDCAPERRWLSEFAAAFAETPDRLLGGRTLNALLRNPYSSASQSLVDYIYGYYNREPDRARFFTSNNMAVSARDFRSSGGFDATFPMAAGEDRELCDRWASLGRTMRYISGALVRHAHALTLRGYWKQHFRYGRSALHVHRARARRQDQPVRLEPPAFYIDLLKHRSARCFESRTLYMAAMLAISQAANAAGYFYERFRAGSGKERTREQAGVPG